MKRTTLSIINVNDNPYLNNADSPSKHESELTIVSLKLAILTNSKNRLMKQFPKLTNEQSNNDFSW